MISDFFEIFLLSIIQGVSEFIPVSSTAHLILASNIYEFKNQSLLIDISLHLGSLLAILFYFKDDIFNFNRNKNLFYKIIIGTLPLIIFGCFLYVLELNGTLLRTITFGSEASRMHHISVFFFYPTAVYLY